MKFLSREMAHVSPDFRPDALNSVNQLFYGSSADIDWYSFDAGVADLYASFQPFLKGFAAWLKRQEITQKYIRVKELCAGPKAGRKWEAIKPAYLELTDFQREPKYNLFDDFEVLSQDKRFDLMFVSYGFDSVWLSQDISLELKKGKWYRKLYRVSAEENLLAAFRTGKSEKRLRLSDLKGKFQIEEKTEEIADMSAIPYGKEITEYCSGLTWAQPNFPGGLIKRVVQAFERQLTKDGMFVTIDTAIPDKRTWKMAKKANISYGHTGSVALYKDEDYGIAKYILEKKGFDVEIIPVKNIIDSFLSVKSLRDSAYREEYESMIAQQYLMTVRKR